MKPISVLTATTLVAGALAVPTATAAQIPALASGELNWPIKESFVSYVQKPFAKGKIEATDGAVLAGKTFKLPVNASASKVDAKGNGTIDTDGSLHFQAHPGLGPDGSFGLDMTFSDIKVVVSGTDATITADVKATGTKGPSSKEALETNLDDAKISTFKLSEAIVPAAEKTYTTKGAQTSLTQVGSDVMLGIYKPGPLEDGNADLTVTYAKAAAEPDPKPEAGSSAGAIGGIIAAIIAILAAVGAAFSGAIPGLKLPKLF
ncbi:HtaA domain-containing protein [Corynebacterium striatum]|uniref:HtaA domain-containing protein n=1 Tax=Corynebacterium striatum TaxID=43770 RepID=UPI00254F360C|nr:HtaA domain-containing protein [Corynebacterium striatum]MDK8812994.1 HtaA domain-containing protein [Corynebacterium striatum]